MAKDEFDSAGDFVPMSELLGELLLIEATEYVPVVNDDNGNPVSGGIVTMHGRKDYVVANITVLSQDGAPVHEDQMILQGGLVGKLKRKVDSGRLFLGVLAKGEAKRGQAAPYVFETPTDEMKQVARNHLAGIKIERATAPDEPADPWAVKQ